MNSQLKETLLDFENYFKKNNIPILQRLQNGCSEEYAIKSLNTFEIKSQELIEMYKWKNGSANFENTAISSLELFPNGIMLSIEMALECYDIYTIKETLWEEYLFPIFTNGEVIITCWIYPKSPMEQSFYMLLHFCYRKNHQLFIIP
jgi:hypothetical protein